MCFKPYLCFVEHGNTHFRKKFFWHEFIFILSINLNSIDFSISKFVMWLRIFPFKSFHTLYNINILCTEHSTSRSDYIYIRKIQVRPSHLSKPMHDSAN